MTSNLARFVLLAAVLLVGCADDSTRLAGGTGSDLPRPTARLFDTAFHPVEAKLYRLWKVQGDSLVPSYQVHATNGFLLPQDGAWVVEAWADSQMVGGVQGLPRTAMPTTSCTKIIARVINGDSGMGIPSCDDLIDTSNHRRPLSMSRSTTPRPDAAGMFVVTDTVRRYMIVPDGVQAFRFLLWEVLWMTPKRPDTGAGVTTHEVDSVLVVFRGEQVSSRKGIVDVTFPKADWLIEGWTATLPDSEMVAWATKQPIAKFADSASLRACAEMPGVDCGRPTRADWIGGKAPDKVFFYRSP
jgi:hypothetical protein